MKKSIAFVLGLTLLSAGFVFSQETASYKSEHYTVTSQISSEHAQSTARMMEAYFSLFESYMHFDPENLSAPLRVRIFSGKEAYNSYLTSVLSETRDSFVFIQYSDPKKSELVGFYGGDDKSFQRRMIHHGFVQYIKSHIPNPPLWLQKGFAVYFENSTYDKEKQQAVFAPNYDWVSTIRQLLNSEAGSEASSRLIPLNTMLYLDAEQANDDLEAFYAQVWATIEFLTHSGMKKYNRLLWDSISALSPEASQQENEKAIVDQAFSWIPRERMTTDYIDYINSIRTFPELVRDGMESYTAGSLENAEQFFSKAIELRADQYVPYYYLGLINYDMGDYSMAEYYYHTALDSGGRAPLVNYALAVNAYADERLEDARFYLEKSLEAGDSYADRVKSLREKIEARSGNSEPEGSGA